MSVFGRLRAIKVWIMLASEAAVLVETANIFCWSVIPLIAHLLENVVCWFWAIVFHHCIRFLYWIHEGCWQSFTQLWMTFTKDQHTILAYPSQFVSEPCNGIALRKWHCENRIFGWVISKNSCGAGPLRTCVSVARLYTHTSWLYSWRLAFV